MKQTEKANKTGTGKTWKYCVRSEKEKTRKNESHRLPAYFTVEASMIVPVAICLIVMILYMAFYLYDRCVLTQDCYILSYRQSIEKGDADRNGDAAVKEQFSQKLFMLSRLETNASGGGTIRVQANAAMQPPLFGLDIFSSEKTWQLGIEGKARKTDPPEAYRKVRRIMNLAARVSSGD